MKTRNEYLMISAAAVPLSLSRTSTVGVSVVRPEVHRISAMYPNPEEAMLVSEALKRQGFSTSAVSVFHALADAAEGRFDETDGSDAVLKDILVDGAIGTGVGAGVGVIGTVLLLLADVTLLVASPVVTTLAMVGWFAGLGGVLGAMVGSDDVARKDGRFAVLVEDAISAGNTVLLVRTSNPVETGLAKQIVKASLQGRDQVAMKVQ